MTCCPRCSCVLEVDPATWYCPNCNVVFRWEEGKGLVPVRDEDEDG
jgi:hypothetical protein